MKLANQPTNQPTGEYNGRVKFPYAFSSHFVYIGRNSFESENEQRNKNLNL